MLYNFLFSKTGIKFFEWVSLPSLSSNAKQIRFPEGEGDMMSVLARG